MGTITKLLNKYRFLTITELLNNVSKSNLHPALCLPAAGCDFPLHWTSYYSVWCSWSLNPVHYSFAWAHGVFACWYNTRLRASCFFSQKQFFTHHNFWPTQKKRQFRKDLI